MNKRIVWLDMLKGWGMLLVMLGHVKIPDFLIVYIYSFHMPLFFFISGYVFNIDKYKNTVEFFKSKSRSLLIPYLSFSLLNYIFWLMFRRFANHNPAIYKPLIGILIGMRGSEWAICTGTLWFVLALFISEIFLFFIIKYSKNKNKNIITWLLVFTFLGCLYNKFVGVRLIWSIDVSFIAVGFLGLGYLTRKNDLISIIKGKKNIILLCLISVFASVLNGGNDMFKGVYGNYIIFYIASIAGIAINIIFIKNLPNIKLLNFIGKNTFIYLAFHQYIVFSVLNKISYKLIGNIQNNTILTLIAILFVIIALIVLYPVIYIINKYFPFLLGKKNE